MENTRELKPAAPQATTEYLGPATVLECEPGRVYLECPDAYVWADLATGAFYCPQPGDLVLLISRAKHHFVIGILKADGLQRIVLPGSLEIAAPQGEIRLRCTGPLTLTSSRIHLAARDVEITARWLWQRCDNLIQKIRANFRGEAGSFEQKVEGDATVEAGRIRHTSRGDIKLRGKSINLN